MFTRCEKILLDSFDTPLSLLTTLLNEIFFVRIITFQKITFVQMEQLSQMFSFRSFRFVSFRSLWPGPGIVVQRGSYCFFFTEEKADK